MAEAEPAELARQHAYFFLALAETAETELCRADQVLWLDRLEQELDNLRAALTWSAETVDGGQWIVDSPAGLGSKPEASSPAPTSRRSTS